MAARVMMITGALGALGRVVASAASEAGYRLALVDFAVDDGGASPAPGAWVATGVDLADATAAEAAIAAAVEKFGRLDVLINVAGGFKWQPLQGSTPADWSELFRLNVLTAANTSRAALPHLKSSGCGRILNIGAAAALKAGAGMGPYAASKAAVHALTQALAEELKGAGVTVNAVLPSIIDTPANRRDMPDADPTTWVAPAALASLLLFLASEASDAITGSLIPITGRV